MDSTSVTSGENIVEVSDEKSLNVEIVSTDAGFDAIAKEWAGLTEVADVTVFQTYEWQRTWWRIFGGNHQLHIILFRENQLLVGIMPFFIDHFRILGHPVYRSLRLIGSRLSQAEKGSVPVELPFGGYLSVIAHPEYKNEVVKTLKDYIQAHPGQYDELILEELPEDSRLLTSLLADFRTTPDWRCTVQNASVCPQIVFPDSWEDLLSNLSSNARYQIRRDIRRVTDDKLFEFKTAVTRQEIKQAFDRLVQFHQQRWHKLGLPGIFADGRLRGFFRDLTLRFHKKGWLALKSVTAEGKYVAIDLYFRFNNTMYLLQRGFDESSDYNQYGPGNVLLYCSMKQALEDGMEAFDFLRGEAGYKMRTANIVKRNKRLIIQHKTSRQKINKLVRKYAHLKRKLKNEKYIMRVYAEKAPPVAAFGNYIKEVFRRCLDKF